MSKQTTRTPARDTYTCILIVLRCYYYEFFSPYIKVRKRELAKLDENRGAAGIREPYMSDNKTKSRGGEGNTLVTTANALVQKAAECKTSCELSWKVITMIEKTSTTMVNVVGPNVVRPTTHEYATN